jgi:phosphoglycolate phosphatase-like HAD superfamily hydrolase
MSLRVAFDLDGVLADLDRELARRIAELFGAPAPAALTPRQQRRLWRHIGAVENFWETLDETEPGVVGRLGVSAAEGGWSVVFLTTRPEVAGRAVREQSERWLEAKGIARPAVHVVDGSRGQVAEALNLDVVVDDRPQHCLDVRIDSNARAILIRRATPGQLVEEARRRGIEVVDTVDECLGILRNAKGPHAPPGAGSGAGR